MENFPKKKKKTFSSLFIIQVLKKFTKIIAAAGKLSIGKSGKPIVAASSVINA